MKARSLEVALAPQNRKWWTLLAVSFGLFMIMLDNTVVNVALQSIKKGLNASRASSNGSSSPTRSRSRRSCSRAASSPTCFGRRRLFIIGLVIFTGSSLACGLAPGAAS